MWCCGPSKVAPTDGGLGGARRGGPRELAEHRAYSTSYLRPFCYYNYVLLLALHALSLVANLHSRSWPPTLIIEAPLTYLGNLATGGVMVSTMAPRYPKLALASFGLMTGTESAVMIGLGLRSWNWLVWCAAVVLWFCGALAISRARLLGALAVVWAAGMHTGLLSIIENVDMIKSEMPQAFAGLVVPVLVSLYEGLSTLLIFYGWQQLYQECVHLETFTIAAALVVQTGEAMRLGGLLTASRSSGDAFASDISLSILSGVLLDVVSRSLRVQSAFWTSIGYDYQVTPEQDVMLRVRLEYGYTPFPMALLGAGVAALHGAPWARRAQLWICMAAGLLGQVLTDLMFVSLHWVAATERETLGQTLRRLHTPGGHRVLSRYQVFTSPVVPAEPPLPEVGKVDSMARAPRHLQFLHQILLADECRLAMQTAISGAFGSCLYAYSQELCTS